MVKFKYNIMVGCDAMFNFLKNKVGRPSNEVKRKRKIFYFICILILILLISLTTYSLTLSSIKDDSILESFDLDKLSGNVSNVGSGVLDIKYIDNVKENSALENTTISIKEKMNYSGADNIYYRLDLYQNNRLISKGACRKVSNDKLATISFKLTKNRLNVMTGIYSDSNCNRMLTRYRTKKYYIASPDDNDKNNVELASIELPKYNATWYVGDISESFSLKVFPTTSTVTLTSSDNDVMEVINQGVNNFRLKAKKTGKVIITATSSDGVSATVTYLVKEKYQISMTKLPETWSVGNYKNIVVETTPNDAIDSVYSTDESIISVEKISDNIYKVKAQKPGTATIIAKSKNGAEKKYTYKVKEVSSISIPDYTSVLTVGKTYGKFSLSVIPKDSKVTLISSNPDVLQVMKYDDNSWGLKAKKVGTVNVVASSSEGAKKTYSYTVIEQPSDISMPKYKDEWNIGDEYGKFSVTVTPTDSTVQVTSSDSTVIEVVKNSTNSWTLKAKKVGTATITASASNGLKTSYTYTVKQNPMINMPKFSNELQVGKTYGRFSLSTTPVAAYVTISSSNPNVLQVMKYGDNTDAKNSWGLKAKKVGTATITATANNGAKVTYTYIVKEKTTITMPKYEDELIVGKEYGKFNITVTPSNLQFTVKSSNSSVLEVVKHGSNSFSLKAKKDGTATITATTDGEQTSYTYKVKEEPKIELPKFSSEWKQGEISKEFSVTVVPSSATVSIESSNPNVMEVIKTGNNKWKLSAKIAGTATITATSSTGVKSTYTYTVKEAPTISMQKYSDELNVGETYGSFSLKTNYYVDSVSLISSDTSVIEIIKQGDNSLNGNKWSLKAKKAGTAEIVATSSEGAKLVYKYKVVDSTLITNGGKISKSWEYNDSEYLVIEKVSPSNSSVSVTSSNSKVISVSTLKDNVSWQLTGVGIGSAKITISSSNGKTENYTYTITEPKGMTLISMPKFSSTLDMGTQTNQFSISVEPSTASVSLASSNPSVIQIMKHGNNSSTGNKWSLKAKKEGTATITATSSTGAKQSYTYTVKKANASISMTQFTSTWNSGSYGTINVQVVPSNSTVTVTSSNPSVMSVYKINNTQWKLKAIANGTATITASASNGKKISYTYNVKHEYPSAYEMIKNNNYESKKAGVVTVYFEKTCSEKSKTNIINFINKLPTYAKKSSQVVYVMTKPTWNKNGYQEGVAGWASMGAVPYIWIPCDRDYSDESDNYALYHEYGHAVDAHYGALSGAGFISNGKDFATLYNNTYRYVSQNGCSKKSNKCIILRGYAYTSNAEFFAESYMMTIRPMVGYSNNVSGITRNWGPINNKNISPFGTIEEEMKKYIKTAEAVIK